MQHGIEYLLETQRGDGSWDEELATGTGFPEVFYLNYHLYKDYFPLLALSAFVKARAALRTDQYRRQPMKPALVTGASGFLGWHVARVLLERGYHVRALVRPGSRVDALDVEA